MFRSVLTLEILLALKGDKGIMRVWVEKTTALELEIDEVSDRLEQTDVTAPSKIKTIRSHTLFISGDISTSGHQWD